LKELLNLIISEAEAGSFYTSAGYFCTLIVVEAPGIAVTSVIAGAPFVTGAPVVTYTF